MKALRLAYLRNFIFGVEDSLVSTVGLLSGVAIAGMEREAIFVTGVVLIFVEAVSMAAGSFLSESTAEEMQTGSDQVSKKSYLASLVMLVSYFVSGFVPLIPYILLPVGVAFWTSIGVSLVALFLLGVAGASLTKTRLMANALRMLFVGGLAIAVGALVGRFIGA